MEAVFRRAIVSDVPAMVELERECFNQPAPFEAIRNFVQSINASCHIVHEDGVLIGIAYAAPILNSMRLVSVAVAPKYRRSKFGTGLVARISRDAKHLMTSVFLRSSNAAGRQFFAKLGWTELRVKDKSVGDPLILVVTWG